MSLAGQDDCESILNSLKHFSSKTGMSFNQMAFFLSVWLKQYVPKYISRDTYFEKGYPNVSSSVCLSFSLSLSHSFSLSFLFIFYRRPRICELSWPMSKIFDTLPNDQG